MSIETIESNRLCLYPMTDKDYNLYSKLYTDEYLTRHTGGALDSQKAKRSFDLSLRSNSNTNFSRYTWTVNFKPSASNVGVCALVLSKKKPRTADIGTILTKESHGQKIATESLLALMTFGFEKLDLNVIGGYSFFQNKISVKLMTSLGFHCTARTEGKLKGNFWTMNHAEWNIHKHTVQVNELQID